VGHHDDDTTTTRAAVGDMTKPIYHESNLYYRADDEQRTLMSGQILLRGLFEKELLIGDHAAAANNNNRSSSTAIIQLHTADYTNDILTPNPRLCPNTFNLFKSAYTSDDYKRWIEHERVEINTIDKFIKSNMKLTNGVGAMGNMIDCIMTTICTDRTLPSYINDYDGTLGPTMFYHNTDDDEEDSTTTTTTTTTTHDNVDTTSTNHNSNMFERIINLAVKNFTFAYKYNNGAFPKLGMGPLWYEIMSNILPIVNPPTKDSSNKNPPPKFALFSGHDTTLMPLLASLGDKVWSGLEWAP